MTEVATAAVHRKETRAAFSRVEHFPTVGSTNDVVRAWLANGVSEVCVATAGEQTAGRGRLGRAWVAPPGAALLVSLGFRPTWLAADRSWRLPATIALAMCDAAEDAAGLRVGAIRMKWPNDLVIEVSGPNAPLTEAIEPGAALRRLAAPVELRKLAGVLGETIGLGTPDPRIVVGIGINADWSAATFPAELAGSMASLREASAGRPIDVDVLLTSFLDRTEARLAALRAGFFDVDTWTGRQVTTGRQVILGGVDGSPGDGRPVTALGVDAATGALVVEGPARDPAASGDAEPGERLVHAAEVTRVRLAAGGV